MTATSLLKKSLSSITQKASVWTHVAFQVNFTLAIPAVYLMCKRNIFGIELSPIYSYMVSQTYYWPTYFVIGLTRINCWWLRKTRDKISMQLFPILRFHITVKSGYRQANPKVDVTKMFRQKSFLDWVMSCSPHKFFSKWRGQVSLI